MKDAKYRVVFMGTPDIGIPALQALVDDEQFDVVGIFTQPDRPVGRKQEIIFSPIKTFGKENYIPVLQPEKFGADANRRLASLKPDVVVVIAYGQILEQETLDIPTRGIVNVHYSLLPKYRGAIPVQAAIINGEKVTGNTIQLMNLGLDKGDILSQKETEIGESETSGELLERLSNDGVGQLMDTLKHYLSGDIKPVPQDGLQATYCQQSDIAKDKARIDWGKPAEEIHNLIRGMNPWPIAWTMSDGKRVRIYRTTVGRGVGTSLVPVLNRTTTRVVPTGKVFQENGNMYVKCGDVGNKNFCSVLEIQMEGKNKVSGKEFVQGYGEGVFEPVST